jgi:methylated-DNA-protein-cysteine methyltransferase-like protein
MVGWALNSTKQLPKWVPAHRVVNRNGLLTGKMHFPGSETMRELLESEGVKVVDNKIVNFDEILWDPMKELD